MTSTVVIRICAPGQSWGTQSYFDERDTGSVPSKTGIVGMLCSAGNIARDDTDSIARVAAAHMAVRSDNPGNIRTDYQTVQDVPTTESKNSRTVVSPRQFLEDACFTVFLTYRDSHDAEDIHAWMRNPTRPLFFGRVRYLAAAGFGADIIREPDTSIDDTIATWPSCQIHPIRHGDTCHLTQDTSQPLWMPGVEEHPGQPIDYMHDSRRRKTRRTIHTSITIRLPDTDQDEIGSAYGYDFTTGEFIQHP